MSLLLNPRSRAVQGAVSAVVLGLALVAMPGPASAATVESPNPAVNVRTTVSSTPAKTSPAITTTASTTTATTTSSHTTLASTHTTTPTTGLVPAIAVSACVPLSSGTFRHTFDPGALTLTVEFVQKTGFAAGTPLCDGGQAFTVATWATESTGYLLPQHLLGTSQASVTRAGEVGQVVITASPTGGCAAQVDAYMAPASAVPAVLTGFNSGEARNGGAGTGAVNEPPLVGTPQAPYPSVGTVAGQQPYTLVAGTVCAAPTTTTTAPPTAQPIVQGTTTTAPPTTTTTTAPPTTTTTTAPPATTTTTTAPPATTTTTAQPIVEGTTITAPPTTTTAQPIVEGASTERTTAPPTIPVTSNPGVQVAGVVLGRTTTDKPTVFGAAGSGYGGSGGLASTGASVGAPLGLGVVALLLGTGLLLVGRRKPPHAR